MAKGKAVWLRDDDNGWVKMSQTKRDSLDDYGYISRLCHKEFTRITGFSVPIIPIKVRITVERVK